MGKPNREVIDVINEELSPVIFKKLEETLISNVPLGQTQKIVKAIWV